MVDQGETHRTAGFPVGPENQVHLQPNHLHTGKFERQEDEKRKDTEGLYFQVQGRSRLENARQS